MAEIIAQSGGIGQFLDRDTRPDFATPMIAFLIEFLDDPEQDLDAYLQKIQDFFDRQRDRFQRSVLDHQRNRLFADPCRFETLQVVRLHGPPCGQQSQNEHQAQRDTVSCR